MTRNTKVLLLCLVAGLVVATAMFLWPERDLRGIYTYPGVGVFLLSEDIDSLPIQEPLTLAIFFSAETECYDCLSEVASYKRLIPVFRERGQGVVAVTSLEDSVEIDSFLHVQQLDIPLVVARLGLTFEEMGMYPKFMPFKILFDSKLSMIYMDGANNTPESQADFEAAMLWLSKAVHEKTKGA